MAKERLYLFDTTLRDGAQTTGVDFSLDDKRNIAAHARRARRRLCRGRLSGRQPARYRVLRDEADASARASAAFGMTKRPGRSASNDPGLAGCWRPMPTRSASSRNPGTIMCASRSTSRARKTSTRSPTGCARRWRKGREALLDCEHFFDGYKANPGYALACAQAAYRSGRALGRALRHQWRHAAARGRAHRRRGRRAACPATSSASMPITTPATRSPIRLPPSAPARGRSRARSTASASAAATPISCSSSRRCCSRRSWPSGSRPALPPKRCGRSPSVSHALDELLNRAPNRHAPYVGASAFATKAGIHASALAKDPRTYEHVAAGQRRQYARRSRLRPGRALQPACRTRPASGSRLSQGRSAPQRLLDTVKEREAQGYAYEAADASFELLARRVLGGVPEFFDGRELSMSSSSASAMSAGRA